jgi:hypothetical protein
MVERCEYFRLTLEPAYALLITRELLRQNFDRHFTFELRVPRAIDLAHAALAKQ